TSCTRVSGRWRPWRRRCSSAGHGTYGGTDAGPPSRAGPCGLVGGGGVSWRASPVVGGEGSRRTSMMRKSAIGCAVLTLVVASLAAVGIAEARVGGGTSGGSRGSRSYSAPRSPSAPPSSPSSPTSPQRNPSSPASPSPTPSRPGFGWGGMIGGFLLGRLLGGLL